MGRGKLSRFFVKVSKQDTLLITSSILSMPSIVVSQKKRTNFFIQPPQKPHILTFDVIPYKLTYSIDLFYEYDHPVFAFTIKTSKIKSAVFLLIGKDSGQQEMHEVVVTATTHCILFYMLHPR